MFTAELACRRQHASHVTVDNDCVNVKVDMCRYVDMCR